MKSAGIIAEYNPFHNGHLYQIETLKQDYGFETVQAPISSLNCLPVLPFQAPKPLL